MAIRQIRPTNPLPHQTLFSQATHLPVANGDQTVGIPLRYDGSPAWVAPASTESVLVSNMTSLARGRRDCLQFR
jgi:hypothetical protein